MILNVHVIRNYGKSPDIKDVTYISLNYHLGGAIIVDGQLLTGATGKKRNIRTHDTGSPAVMIATVDVRAVRNATVP